MEGYLEGVLFEFHKGRTYVRDFDIIGWSPKIDQVYFTVKDDTESKTFIFQKTLGNDITLIETDTTDDGRIRHQFNLLINATDTDGMNIDTDYVFDVAIISGEIKETVITGILRLKGTATQTYNEKETMEV